MSTGLVHRSNGDENATVNINKNGKPKPLQASTNIIHSKTPRRIDNLIYDKSRQLTTGKKLNDPLRKKHPTAPSGKKASKSSNDAKKITSTANVEKVDENDISAMVKNAYDPLTDVYQFDEELFQKVMKLEYADDGIPEFDSTEPFDF